MIPLVHLSAAEVEHLLVTGQGLLVPGGQTPGSPRPGQLSSLAPRGIVALTVDTARNALRVTGTPAALEELRGLITMLDEPVRQVRLSVLVIRTDGTLQPELLRREQDGDTALLDDEQVASLRARARQILLETELVCDNNRPLRLYWEEGGRSTGFEVLPRRSDGDAVTLHMPITITQEGGGGAPVTHLRALRRLGMGQTGAVTPRSGGPVVLIGVHPVDPPR